MTPRMPFGKFKGSPLTALPDSYIEWLASLDDLREPLRTSVHAEWTRRQARQPEPEGRRKLCPSPAIAEALISAGLHSLAQRHHPDCGGSHEAMVAINSAAAWLRELARSAAA